MLDGVRRAQTLFLDDVGRAAGGNALHAGADHDKRLGRLERGGGVEHVFDHRLAGDAVHDLGQGRAHARALARGEYDDGEVSIGHKLRACPLERWTARIGGVSESRLGESKTTFTGE